MKWESKPVVELEEREVDGLEKQGAGIRVERQRWRQS